MIKSIWYVAVTALIITAIALAEYFAVSKTFDTLDGSFAAIETKLENENCSKDDILSLQKLWIASKETLHIFIPHNEIKEVDLWVSECVYYASKDDFKEAAAKIEVARELFEQIPKTFLIRIENIL